MIILLFLVVCSTCYNITGLEKKPVSGVLFYESFDGKASHENWIISGLSNYTGIWKVQTAPHPRTDTYEKMLVLQSKKLYSGISIKFENPILIREKPFILQFEVRAFNNFTCSGAYVKLIDDSNFDQSKFSNETDYFLMFGPDLCGDKQLVSFIFKHKNPFTLNKVEKALKNPPKPVKDDLNHLYTLIVRPDGSYAIKIDNKNAKIGRFNDDFQPSIIPPKMIPDPSVKKPDDWDDRQTIPSALNPDVELSDVELIPDPKKLNPPKRWLSSEQKYLPDLDAKKPENWDDELLGEWKPPIIENPKCFKNGCGKYYPPFISNPNYFKNWDDAEEPNPNYKGPWKPPEIPNPEYFVDNTPYLFPTFYSLGFELLSADGHIAFNNILIADDEAAVVKWNSEFWEPRKKHQQEGRNPPKPPKNKHSPATNVIGKVGFIHAIFNLFKREWFYMLYVNPVPTLILTFGVIITLILLFFFLINKICPSEIDSDDLTEEEKQKFKAQK